METLIIDTHITKLNEQPISNDKSNKKKKKKCSFCKNKLTLINFKCRCEKTFCLSCKNPETHNCSYNYIDHSKKILKNKLVKVQNSTITKI